MSGGKPVVAIDLPGFGGSERRDDLLSPRGMAGFLLRFTRSGTRAAYDRGAQALAQPVGEAP